MFEERLTFEVILDDATELIIDRSGWEFERIWCGEWRGELLYSCTINN